MVSGLDLRQQLHQLYGHNHLLVRILVGSILILVPQLHVTWQLVHVDLPNAVIDIGNTQLVHPEVLQRTLEVGWLHGESTQLRQHTHRRSLAAHGSWPPRASGII